MKKTELEFRPGTLIMAATHLGCLEDIPSRTLSWLKDADLLIFEEDRPARLMLKTAKLQRNYLKFNEHEQKETLAALRQALKSGQNVLYVADQGTPNLADPGRLLLEAAYALKARVTVVPGPSAIAAAIAACPLRLQSFYYAGFLPQSAEQRERKLRELLRCCPDPLLILDTPYRLQALLTSCETVLGAGQQLFLALDISGPEERFLKGSVAELRLALAALDSTRLNFVLIVGFRA